MENPNSEQQTSTLEKRLTYAIARYAFARLEVEEWNIEVKKLWGDRQKINNVVGCAEL